MEKLRVGDPGMTEECLNKIRWGGIEAATGKIEDCYKFDPPRRWKGLFFTGFEVSRFCPEPARECSDDTPGEHIWLAQGPSIQIPRRNGESGPEPELFRVDFIGRKTTYPGGHGHTGASEEEIIVDRLISLKQVEPSPK